MTPEKKRIKLLDTGRGLMMILVMWFHLSYDLYYIFGIDVPYMRGSFVYYFRDAFVGVLIIISGISANLTRSNIKRGIRTLLIGLLLTLLTLIFYREELIIFGILHFFGCAMIIYGLFEDTVIKKIKRYAGITANTLLFIIFYYYLYIKTIRLEIPGDSVFLNLKRLFLFIIGIRTGVYSADYYPVFPWIFLFFLGAFLGRGIRERELPNIFYKSDIKLINFIGRHSLIIYLLHQPLFLLILIMVSEESNCGLSLLKPAIIL